jgi:hypothetical protein
MAPVIEFGQPSLTLKQNKLYTFSIRISAPKAGRTKLSLTIPENVPVQFSDIDGVKKTVFIQPTLTSPDAFKTVEFPVTMKTTEPGNFWLELSASLKDASGTTGNESVNIHLIA